MDQYTIEEFEIGRLTFAREKYDDGIVIKFTEYQQDPWHGNSEVEVDIDEVDAQKIVNFLKRYFPNME